jgi:hypothetical protein
MVDNIGEWAARLGNEKLFMWALRNDFYIIETGDQLDVFIEAAENGHKNTGISRWEAALLVQLKNFGRCCGQN